MTVAHTDTEEKFLHVSSLVGNKSLRVYSICKSKHRKRKIPWLRVF